MTSHCPRTNWIMRKSFIRSALYGQCMRDFRAKTAAILILRYADFYLCRSRYCVAIFDEPDRTVDCVETFDSWMLNRKLFNGGF